MFWNRNKKESVTYDDYKSLRHDVTRLEADIETMRTQLISLRAYVNRKAGKLVEEEEKPKDIYGGMFLPMGKN